MLIRSGLIQNFDHIDAKAFGRHWREVHGPLAARLPNLRGYVQNHIVARGKAREEQMHRIDGISQLWFDDVQAMTTGMASPENDACIADIAGFLSKVTLAIQDPGMWKGPSAAGAKILAVYVGEGSVAEIEDDLAAALADRKLALCGYRVNRMLGGKFIVDPSIARSEAPVLAIVEAFLADDDARRRFLEAGVPGATGRRQPAAVLAVEPHVFIPPPS